MKVIQFNPQFIESHMNELIHLEDYVPEVSFIVYDKHHERDKFLKSKNLLETIKEMDQVLDEKCKHSKSPIMARDTIIIEWLDCHPEFEGIIAKESWEQYQQIKAIYEEFTFFDLLYDVELSSEKKVWVPPKGDGSLRDDSSIQLPDFNKKDTIFDKYGVSLLACYLSYIV